MDIYSKTGAVKRTHREQTFLGTLVAEGVVPIIGTEDATDNYSFNAERKPIPCKV
ncbi:MAG: hypothetical protein J6P74_00590 [Paludibacteraceae bacterium]|nr:hypothetical protein [Paludibacteraceae bacterium]